MGTNNMKLISMEDSQMKVKIKYFYPLVNVEKLITSSCLSD